MSMELIEELARAHRDDKDSGESLVEDLRLHLHRIDPKAFYDLAVPYLTQTLRNGDSRQVAGLLPVYVGQLSDDDGAPLMELLDQICRRDTRAASTFAKGIVDFLSKPWASAHVDSHTISALRSRLNTWRCASR